MQDSSRERDSEFDKELLVALPLLASLLAVTWESGSFYAIGRSPFYLFSLPEHLIFALFDLPIALLSAGLLIVGVHVVPRPVPSRVRFFLGLLGRILLLSGVTFALVGPYYTHLGDFTVRTYVIGITGATGLVFLAEGSWLKEGPRQLAAAVFALLVAFSVGYIHTESIMSDGAAVNLRIADTVRHVVILRAGERGLALYDPGTDKISFEKWDEVKGFEYVPNR